ncbi:HAD family hydrolase [Actinophytocola algeriensis]|uniref:Putative hydrolase of the HAD superfamily n=1 Tax=Actinophytocola algeriensis TaxID=1768010 RepID=A0A7W7VH78_9PSEU|nr:HAD-IA family hydrolase [Actinophytocola algeriensis]MBB4910123.1 putative hydrolase of the HAD superfamily [Actinophytocola algeriensis]MBE1480889.1 putative hydrolase of the HAD superfamily [Actinophytocola algeriensis]
MGTDALVFDFDGLLMDTETASLRVWQYLWREYGLELDVSTFFAQHGGNVIAERYAKLAAAVGPAFDQDEAHDTRLTYRREVHATLELAAGIARWLDEARELGIRLAVASSSPRDWVVDHLTRVGYLDRFELLACGDEAGTHKPDPGVYLLALERLGVPAERALAFEDTVHGVAAAKAAGLRCVAIPHPNADPAAFTAAERVLTSAADVPLRVLIGPE